MFWKSCNLNCTIKSKNLFPTRWSLPLLPHINGKQRSVPLQLLPSPLMLLFISFPVSPLVNDNTYFKNKVYHYDVKSSVTLACLLLFHSHLWLMLFFFAFISIWASFNQSICNINLWVRLFICLHVLFMYCISWLSHNWIFDVSKYVQYPCILSGSPYLKHSRSLINLDRMQ